MTKLAISIICKDEVAGVATLVKAFESSAEIFITTTDKGAKKKFRDSITSDKVHWSHFDWIEDFAAARNYNLEQIKQSDCTHWAWVDSDDIVQPASRLAEIAESMEAEGVDVVYLPYHYKLDALGQTVNYQKRERVIRTGLAGEWKGAVHETFVPDTPLTPDKVRILDVVQYVHVRAEGDEERSSDRNHKILERLYKQEPKDPRDVYYLAISYFGQKNWDKAIELFIEYIQLSGWDEEKYYAWLYVAECSLNKQAYDRAISACMGAIELLPHYPDAYYVLQQVYYDTDQYEKSLEWFSIGESKPQPQTNRVIDPTVKKYRGKMSAAVSLLALGETERAWEMINRVKDIQPDDEAVQGIFPEFATAYYYKKTIQKAAWLAEVLQEMGEDGAKIINALPPEMQLDPGLRETRRKVIPPKKWPKKSIVFYCGQGFETWGPDTLEKGMGGSEEAIVYLSRELANQGWEVTVYNGREKSYDDNGITYLPHTEFNPDDEFDVLVAWRTPSLHRIFNTKARVRAVDLHDMGEVSKEDAEYVDKFFVKSKYHLEQTKVPVDKAVVISNGIVPEQLEAEVTRNPTQVIYGSSADRGLEYLLNMWPEVKLQVPEAELVWAYGWNTFDKAHAKNPQMMKWKWEMVRKMADVGCKALGRLSHEELGLEFLASGVWAYPTDFEEINCITAIKAGKAGCTPITTGYAALQETVLEEQENIGKTINVPARQEKFINRLVDALQNPRTEAERAEYAKKYDVFAWENISKDWDSALS